jgi:CRP-like cAMP-binding protein
MRNRLLSALPSADLKALEPHLQLVELKAGSKLELPGTPSKHAHFIESGLISVVIKVGGTEAEVGLVGREGLIGVPAVLGSEVADYFGVVRHAGEAYRIEVDRLREVMAAHRSIGALVLRYVQAGTAQIIYSSFANGHLNVPGRLARWLLMAHDRIDGDTLTLTHDTLAAALGSKRPGVTTALHQLEGDGALRSRRNQIVIRDRDKLAAAAGPTYGPAERAYDSLIGPAPAHGGLRSTAHGSA